MSNTAYITHYEKLYDFLTNQTKVIKDFHVLDMGMVVMEYVHTEEFQEADYKTNVIITSMCSAYLHLKLWRIMNWLGNRVMYHDTDSVIYVVHQQDHLLSCQLCPYIPSSCGQNAVNGAIRL